MSLLTDKEKEELQKLADELVEDSKLLVEEYKETPSELSGSSFHFHQNSPFLDEK